MLGYRAIQVRKGFQMVKWAAMVSEKGAGADSALCWENVRKPLVALGSKTQSAKEGDGMRGMQ